MQTLLNVTDHIQNMFNVIFDIYNIKIAIKSLVKEIDVYIDAKWA